VLVPLVEVPGASGEFWVVNRIILEFRKLQKNLFRCCRDFTLRVRERNLAFAKRQLRKARIKPSRSRERLRVCGGLGSGASCSREGPRDRVEDFGSDEFEVKCSSRSRKSERIRDG